MPLINLFTTMYFYFGILNWYAIVCVNKLYISEDIWWWFYLDVFMEEKKQKKKRLNHLKVWSLYAF